MYCYNRLCTPVLFFYNLYCTVITDSVHLYCIVITGSVHLYCTVHYSQAGKLYLVNLGVPRNIYKDANIKWSSPFGAKFVIPLHDA